MKHATRILQFTDLHLFGDKKKTLLGINPYASLKEVIAKSMPDIKRNKPELILVTGDLSQDFSRESYEIVAQICHQFPCQTIVTLGNHDDSIKAAQIFTNINDPKQKSLDIADWHIIVLDSHWPECVAGNLDSEELAFFDQALKEAKNKPTLVFLHHQALPTSCLWLDKIGLSNCDDFISRIDVNKNIKAVICGHIHQETFYKHNNIDFISTPSTCWQFALNSDSFKLDNNMPGYRWFDLFPDGTYKTSSVRIDYDKKFVPNLTSEGY